MHGKQHRQSGADTCRVLTGTAALQRNAARNARGVGGAIGLSGRALTNYTANAVNNLGQSPLGGFNAY